MIARNHRVTSDDPATRAIRLIADAALSSRFAVRIRVPIAGIGLRAGCLAACLLVICASFLPANPGRPPGIVQAVASGIASHTGIAATAGAERLRFEANRGQVPGDVAFVARGHDYVAYVTAAGIALSPRSRQPQVTSQARPASASAARTLWLRFAGAAKRPTIRGLQRLPGTSNYFIGNDPRRWRTGVPSFGAILYHGLYPGIDALFYEAGRGLEYDLRVAPGADPRAIRLIVTGGQTTVSGSALQVRAAAGTLMLGAPTVYQLAAGRRRAIAARYLLARGAVGFTLGRYDRTRPLVIDPTLIYSIYLGGAGDDQGNGIAVDAHGRVYISGQTSSTNFSVAAQGEQPTYSGGACADYYTCGDAFVAKLSADGRTLLYRTYLGGSRADSAWTIALDVQGNAYVEGRTLSPNFPLVHALQPRLKGGGDAFVAKLSPDGDKLLYSTYLGGSDNDQALGIAVDGLGQAFVTGYTSSRDFPLAGALQGKNKAANGAATAFVAKLSASGQKLLYSTYLGGSSYESAGAIAVDAHGNAYVTGSTQSRDFPLAHALYRFSGGDHPDAFVSELSASGGTLLFSTHLGGKGETIGTSIAVDGAGQIFVAGSTTARDFPTRHAIQPLFAGSDAVGWGDVFLTKLGAGGARLLVSTYLGGKGDEQALGLALDGRDDVFVAGATTSTDFPTRHPVQPGNHTARSCKERMPYTAARRGYTAFAFPCADAFVTQLGNGGTTLRASTYLGGALGDGADFIAADSAGSVYVVGTTRSPNFPLVRGHDPGISGGSDVFVAKIGA